MNLAESSGGARENDPTLIRYVARELTAGSNPKIVAEELQRDYGLRPDQAATLMASARRSLSQSPTLRGDEEVVANLEAGARASFSKAQAGLVALVFLIAIIAISYATTGKVTAPVGLAAVAIAGVLAWIRWRQTRHLLDNHRDRRAR